MGRIRVAKPLGPPLKVRGGCQLDAITYKCESVVGLADSIPFVTMEIAGPSS